MGELDDILEEGLVDINCAEDLDQAKAALVDLMVKTAVAGRDLKEVNAFAKRAKGN